MTEFNLERALAGEPVVTRGGRKVSQIVKLDALNDQFVVFGVIDNSIRSFTIDGKFNPSNGNAGYDLFMAPKRHTVSIYRHKFDDELTAIVDGKYSTGANNFELLKKIEVEL